MDGGLRRVLSARPTSTAYYPISVRRAATLLHAAFRPRLTTTPLRFANPSPPSSWIRDLHPQIGQTCLANNTDAPSGACPPRGIIGRILPWYPFSALGRERIQTNH